MHREVQMAEMRPVREEAPAVLALQRAGAMLVGKANCHELGLGMSGVNPACGTPRNPYNPTCCAGGSSSGSAAIVSAGICAFALGELFRYLDTFYVILWWFIIVAVKT